MFAGARIAATISREVAIALVTAGAGNALSVARGLRGAAQIATSTSRAGALLNMARSPVVQSGARLALNSPTATLALQATSAAGLTYEAYQTGSSAIGAYDSFRQGDIGGGLLNTGFAALGGIGLRGGLQGFGRNVDVSLPARSSVSDAGVQKFGVRFFGEEQVRFYTGDSSRLGRADQEVFFSPLDDVASVRNAADAARLSGHAPSVTRAYTEGGDVFGLAFPTNGLKIRPPTVADAGGFPHFLEGGQTAVRLPDPNGGYLVNPVREFVTPGVPVPEGSLLFKIGPDGEWISLRNF